MCNIWKDIQGYEGVYQVNTKGGIRRILQKSGTQAGRLLKDFNNGRGYRYITLRHNNIPKNTYVHILVAKAFIPNPDNLPQVNHKDGNKQNNSVDNLEWVTGDENMQHANGHNLLPNGEKHYAAKITNNDVLKIRYLSQSGVALKEITNMYKISKANIHRIINRQIWKHI